MRQTSVPIAEEILVAAVVAKILIAGTMNAWTAKWKEKLTSTVDI